MNLTRLEISGFKSFAKNTVLEFPHTISGVVGPNGSGKSNVADAIRWVLGEQSMKHLRGKKGEDLIFNGSNSAPRLSKASVNLVFDNSKKEFPLEFDEVAIGRRVYRDGVNDYVLNGSVVRLKDIIELLANVGFGSSQHHIIGQGEADRILYTSASERREMIEDALGLKIFQIKRLEAERKLLRTEENMREVAALQREIQPHLKFLKTQAEKYEISSRLREDLGGLFYGYLTRKLATISKNLALLASNKSEPHKKLQETEAEIRDLRKKIEKSDSESHGVREVEDIGIEDRLRQVRSEQIDATRELGKLEGQIFAEERAVKEIVSEFVPKRDIEILLSEISAKLSKIGAEEVIESIWKGVLELKKFIADFVTYKMGKAPEKADKLAAYKSEYAKVKARLDEMKRAGDALSHDYEEKIKAVRKVAEETRKEEKKVYQLELEAGKLKDELRSFDLEEEKIKLSREEYDREAEESKIYLGARKIELGEPFESDEESVSIRRKIERSKLKLEEAGGIDPEVLKEYDGVSKRDEFLTKELSDLGSSASGLRQVARELEERLDHDFKEGVLKINTEFAEFFKTMFGGGKASLKVIEPKIIKHNKKIEDAEVREEFDDAPQESGIDIFVDLPRKRIKSLDMLSGGERALTSIALLFAMSAVNPPPFLVLDETDAALDEANSQRYAKMLENLSKTTQLILITHNRSTMKCAGILYGVTMGADGISKLLSIKFEDAGSLVA